MTAIFGVGSGYRPIELLRMTFDHPFTYIIRDNTNGEILFMGEKNLAK